MKVASIISYSENYLLVRWIIRVAMLSQYVYPIKYINLIFKLLVLLKSTFSSMYII
jgi:hypothetical protein